jgi:hypothetical protein
MKTNRVFYSLVALALASSFPTPSALAAPLAQSQKVNVVQDFSSDKKPLPRPKPTPGPHEGGNDD